MRIKINKDKKRFNMSIEREIVHIKDWRKIEMSEKPTLKQKLSKGLPEELLITLFLITILFSLEGFLDEKLNPVAMEKIGEYMRDYWFITSMSIPLILVFINELFKRKYLKRITNSPAFTFKFDRSIIGILISFQLYMFAVNIDFLPGGLIEQIRVLDAILCLFYFVICIIRKRRLQMKENNESSREPSYRSDNAINTFDEDQLQRGGFVNRLVESVNSWKEEESIVIGLYGEWGTGKTSVLNLMKEKFNSEKNTILVSFNPWYFKDEEQLILQFFNKLIIGIEENFSGEKSKLISNIKKYSQKITSVTLRMGMVNLSIKDFIPSGQPDNDIHSLKKDIESRLEREGKKIIVLIDDLDRLDDKEIHSIFKLVKVIADFSYTTYILSLDEEKVGGILSEQYSSKKENEIGQSFLEKIVQVPLHLPPADPSVVRKVIFEGIKEILKENDVTLSNETLAVWQSNWESSFGAFPLTIRAAKRYQNSIYFSLPLVRDEVYFVDYLCIEGIRVFLPNVYKFIYKNSNGLINVNRRNNSEIYTNHEQELKKTLENYSDYQKKKITALLDNLFPTSIGTDEQIKDTQERWSKQKRICSPDYFEKYFIYSVREGQISDIKFDTLIKKLGKELNLDTSNKIKEMISECGLEEVIVKFSINIENLNSTQAKNLIFYLMRVEDLIINSNNYFIEEKTANLISKLVNFQEKNKKQNLVKEILSGIQSIIFCEKIFKTVKTEIPGMDMYDIAIPFIEKLKNEIEKPDFLETYRYHLQLFLEHWNKWGDKSELRSTVEEWGNKGEIEKLLVSFAPSNGSGSVGNFTKNGYDNLKTLNLTEVIANILLKDYSIPTYEPKNPYQFGNLSDQERVATQFLLIYQEN
ncbi:KAP family NTPase [Bacillus albus]|uniref:KAP family P-loop NTPase fold protein n=1 Tax=Bacillus albus TaxID=2026189 RepID=UPI001C11A731|nr:P-loop NTPase fold protein [Bacillus albus]MBU5219471.1 KAP family NTPase [Bacillus albus]